MPRFCDQALYSSGVLQIRPPRSASVFLKLWGLKYGNPAAANASLKMALIALALLRAQLSDHMAVGVRSSRVPFRRSFRGYG